jgi:hypothetical protein
MSRLNPMQAQVPMSSRAPPGAVSEGAAIRAAVTCSRSVRDGQEVQMSSDDAAGREEAAVTEVGEVRDAAGTPAASDAAELGKVRDLVLQAHPDVVPDLVRGNSLDELLASVEPARSAYQHVAERVRTSATTHPTDAGAPAPTPRPPAVPAGGATTVLDPSTLGPTTKIARALAERRNAP